ncbi:MAG: hypothetical protein JW864_04050 [Spirochaetes bacterium]|nr:hypothetical protein [Spirochaetota bacterium]
MSIFEIVMLICFGAAWPFSIMRSWTSRKTSGKSIIFLLVIFAGYISGVIHKIFYNPDKVIILYIANGIMVLIDILLYLRNKKLEGGYQNA